MRGSPPTTAIVAGTAPSARTDGLQLARHLEVAAARQAVRDQRALERDDGPAGGERVGDFGLDSQP